VRGSRALPSSAVQSDLACPCLIAPSIRASTVAQTLEESWERQIYTHRSVSPRNSIVAGSCGAQHEEIHARQNCSSTSPRCTSKAPVLHLVKSEIYSELSGKSLNVGMLQVNMKEYSPGFTPEQEDSKNIEKFSAAAFPRLVTISKKNRPRATDEGCVCSSPNQKKEIQDAPSFPCLRRSPGRRRPSYTSMPSYMAA
jgi:hypothetical protein